MEKIFSLLSGSTDETHQWGIRLGANLSCPFLIGLVGDLGSGKTVLVQGIARGMRISTPVKSPSFTIVQEYPGRHPLFHFDLYRIQSEEEMFYLGYQEYFYQEKAGVVIEWVDKIPHLLPSEYLVPGDSSGWDTHFGMFGHSYFSGRNYLSFTERVPGMFLRRILSKKRRSGYKGFPLLFLFFRGDIQEGGKFCPPESKTGTFPPNTEALAKFCGQTGKS